MKKIYSIMSAALLWGCFETLPPPVESGGPCDSEGRCNAGLTCRNGACVVDKDGDTTDGESHDSEVDHDADRDAKTDVLIVDSEVDHDADRDAGDGEVTDSGVDSTTDAETDGEPVCQPRIETCNGRDDDCDELIDEDFIGLGEACSVGEGVCRTNGTNVCSPDHQSVVCDAVPTQGSDEVCNGLDDNCDGDIDEGLGGQSITCGLSVCEHSVTACNDNGEIPVCDPLQGQSPEICNGLDDDCDGNIDNGVLNACGGCGPVPLEVCDGVDNDCDELIDEDDDNNLLVRTCYTGPAGTVNVGVCESGLETCRGGSWSECEGETTPSDEICDDRDNDCDGHLDDLPTLGNACTAGNGQCQRNGQIVCSVDGPVCNAQPAAPQSETCDGIDNDCDGNVDNAPAGGWGECQVPGGRGICSRGFFQCQNRILACQQEKPAEQSDLCNNGVDDDCDGQVDEDCTCNNAGSSQDCTTDLLGICRNGTQVCQAVNGSFRWGECVSNRVAEQEICDGIDNDCNGRVDDLPGINVSPCMVGVGACQRFGVRICGDGPQPICSVQPGVPQDEICDGIDNDCDGETDELAQCQPDAAIVDAAVPDASPIDAGLADAGCVPTNNGIEVCDQIDNDCNGRVDDLNQACSTGIGGCLRQGQMICNGGAPVCNAPVGEPQAEGCDNVDNDCDGWIDGSAANGWVTYVCGPNQPYAHTVANPRLLYFRNAGPNRYDYNEAQAYCQAQGGRTPTADEARIMVMGCADLVNGCDPIRGPGEGGCYWQAGIWQGDCDDYRLQEHASCKFTSGICPAHQNDNLSYRVRCVKDAP